MDFIRYMPEIFAPWNLMVLVLGTVGGLILGAAPGLSPTMAVALLIPFTFHMDSATSLILLGAVYTATVAGGAISAILINIPGAPANIATVLDGHPMAKQGRAAEALHYAFISSVIGGVLGVAVLILFTPVLAELALKFGPAELFWTAVLGVTVIGSLGAGSLLKGLFAGVFGLWLSTIGYDPINGVQRFVFTDHLQGGINIIAALIGLFAIPQVFGMFEGASAAQRKTMYEMENRSVLDSLRTNLRRVKTLAIGSVVGAIVGLIPGAGGQIAGLVSYDQNRKFSAHGANFGKGEPDGVIASESANNAMVGPSLVPLLTLSVPGSPTAAVLLGGLLIHGLFPGPNLFTTHAKVTWTFIDSLLLGQILMGVLGLTMSRMSRWVMTVPDNYMAAAVVVLAVFGTYSVENSFSDVLVMMTLGSGMYFATKFGFSPAPVVLGVILGPIAENNFMQGRLIAQTQHGLFEYFCTGTINLIMIALCAISIGYSAYAELRARKRRKLQGSDSWQHA
ncbi:MAG: tripartite tricarboxylate transporter permease [Pseudolabrys sp.]